MTDDTDIQVERGNFTRIHNKILEQVARGHFSSREYAAILYLLRVTYGYQKTEERLSGEDWENGTDIKRQNIMPAVTGLVKRNIIIQKGGGRGRGNVATYKFNKYFVTWKENESTGMQLKMNPRGCILEPENESTGMQENESTGMQCTSGLKKGKKAAVKKGENAAAPLPFVTAYERIWGLLVPSPYVAEQIADWSGRVTLEAWEYGLKECADANKVGQMKYLTSILERIERGGMVSLHITESQTDFVMEDVL